jgi:hypothetical protein
MPCFTKVLVTMPTDKYTLEARRKLGIRETGDVSEEDAVRIRVEAGKLKTAAQVRALNPGAMIQGLQVGSKKLTIQINI